MLELYDLSINHSTDAGMIPVTGLVFGWKMESDRENVTQATYVLRIFAAENGEVVFDSGTVKSTVHYEISFGGLSLATGKEYLVRVCVTDDSGERATLERRVFTAISPEEWQGAEWIRPAKHISGWAPYLRTKFKASGIRQAVLYASGLGVADFSLNGRPVAPDDAVDPPASNYEKIVYYRRYDVTGLVREGGNCLAVLLGEGFYSQSRVWRREGMIYGKECVIARLDLIAADGSVRHIVTAPDTWKSHPSPYTVNNIYGGETYDTRLEIPDFSEYESADDGWEKAVADETPKGVLTPCFMPPVRAARTLPAVEMHGASGKNDGAWVYDIGENIAGTAVFHLPPSPRGAVYVFRYAENLNASGGIDLRSTGSYATQCIQQDIYIARGDAGGEVYRPKLTYHGFRYVEISGIFDMSAGYGTTPALSIVTGVALTTGFASSSAFETSNEDLEHLLKITDTTFRSNYHGFPEDCPVRERCGWLGDAQILADYGLLNYDSTVSYEKYMEDIRTTREVAGDWLNISPLKRRGGLATPLWGCAQILIPYCLWKYKGDEGPIRRYFGLMEEWVAHERARAVDFVISEGLGDWCPPITNRDTRRIPVPQSSTFMFYEICLRMEEMCRAFGLGDAEAYRALGEQIGNALISRFYDRENHTFGYHASDAVALTFGIYPEGEREALLSSLTGRIEREGFEMQTGIYGNKYLIPLLFEEGYGDMALRLLFSREHTSFGTMMDAGATIVWEMLEMSPLMSRDAGIVHSFNHPMHAGFLYAVTTHIGGLRPIVPGFARFAFSPCPASAIDRFSLTTETPAGKIAVSLADGVYTLTVPAGAVAEILPNPRFSYIEADGKSCFSGKILGSGRHTVAFR